MKQNTSLKVLFLIVLCLCLYIGGFFASYPYLLDAEVKNVSLFDTVRNVMEYSVMYISLMLFCAFLYQKGKFLRVISSIILVLLSLNFMISASCFFIYEQGFNIGMMVSILDTNVAESLSMVKTLVLPILFSVLFFICSWFLVKYLSKIRYSLVLKLMMSLWLLMPVIFYLKHRFISNKGGGFMVKNALYHGKDLVGAYNFRNEMDKVKNNKVTYHLEPYNSDAQVPQNIVVFIGESARRQNMSLYGYNQRNTTPLVSKEIQNIKLFTHAYAPAAITNLAVPIILSNVEMNDYSKNFLSISDNIVNVANHLGYETYWLSTQGGARGITAIASFAKNKAWVNGYDEVLLPELANILNNNSTTASKKMIIVHINGSHPYSCDKYPAKEEIWKGDIDDCYDNSIRYTDKILGQTIQKLKNTNSVLVYVSDHGQVKKEGVYSHGDYREAVQVPYFIWYSPLYKTNERNTVVKDTISTSSLYSTVLQLMNVRNPKAVNNQGKYLKLDMSTIDYMDLK
ncbi:phosphoethanolamine transferase [Riemerella columbina]|uniref:phosphoethanolamine transferase n=1 Tax=Riemerella columbina TaxID=103810 RepID=UPI000688FC7B|nr:phosphoethanolamine transferase [Riemerella columbina]